MTWRGLSIITYKQCKLKGTWCNQRSIKFDRSTNFIHIHVNLKMGNQVQHWLTVCLRLHVLNTCLDDAVKSKWSAFPYACSAENYRVTMLSLCFTLMSCLLFFPSLILLWSVVIWNHSCTKTMSEVLICVFQAEKCWIGFPVDIS